MRFSWSHRRHMAVLGAVFALLFIALAFNVNDRKDWLLENALVVLAVLGLGLSAKRFPLSRISYTLIFLFLCLHEIGAHFTYALVPYDQWFQALTGHTFNSVVGFERNNFDRLVHCSFGLLLAYPIREVFIRVAEVKGFWSYYLPLDVTMAFSMLYELIEWAAAELFGGDLGQAYLGTQGDIWDAQKDMGMATLGALVAMLITAALNAKLQRDFAREWGQSLAVKGKAPLGEDEIERMLNEP